MAEGVFEAYVKVKLNAQRAQIFQIENVFKNPNSQELAT